MENHAKNENFVKIWLLDNAKRTKIAKMQYLTPAKVRESQMVNKNGGSCYCILSIKNKMRWTKYKG